MKFFSQCERCGRRKELTRSAFVKFLTNKLKTDFETTTSDSNAMAYATIEFQAGCPDCIGNQGQSVVTVVIGWRKTTKH